jgi:hypothetical protein
VGLEASERNEIYESEEGVSDVDEEFISAVESGGPPKEDDEDDDFILL